MTQLGDAYAIVGATIVTMRPLAARGRDCARVEEADLGIVSGGSIVVRGGRVVSIEASAAAVPDDVDTIDGRGRLVMPGFVDPHTHALFAGDRVADFEDLAAGRKPALGIRYTVEQTRRCSQDELEAIGAKRLRLMREHGTTTAEVKTGYALTADGEVAMLRAIAALDARPDLPHVVATFCGAHALPPEFATYDDFIDELCARILPRVAATKLATFADAFCEAGYFTPQQSERFLSACAAAGMRLRLHADELSHSGGALLAARLGAVSADHLNYADAEDVAALATAGTIAVLCPATTEYLGLDRYAPARELIAAGVPVALGTDFNPGTSPCPSQQVVAHLARRRLRMTAPEAIAGVTMQAARSVGSAAGVLAAGAPADLVILETGDYREFGYYYGVNLVAATSMSWHA